MKNLAYLVADCARNMRKLFDLRMRDDGITGPQARLLLTVRRKPGGQQGHYATMLDVEPITLCRMLDRMVEAQLLERRPDPADRRARLVFPTSKGDALANRVEDSVAGFMGDMTDCFDADEIAQLDSALTKMAAQLEMLTAEEEREVANG